MNGKPWVLVDGAEPSHLKGRKWNGEKFEEQMEVPWKDILWSQSQITHYIGLVELAYKNFNDYLRIGATQYYRFLLWTARSRQYLYNSKRIARQDRMQVLQFLVERHTENPGQAFSAFGVAREIHSHRIWQHPDGNRIRRYYDLLPVSFCESGDLKKNNQDQYLVHPNALTTLSMYELEERRHKDAQRTATWIKWLTVILAAAALGQAIFLYFDFANPGGNESVEIREEPVRSLRS